MESTLNILVFIVALSHLGFMVLEIFYWSKPLGLKIFNQTLDKAKASKILAANQGVYNGFLAAGLLWSLLHSDLSVATELKIFFLSCVAVAGIFGAITVNRKIFFVQASPALLALLLIVLDLY